MRFILKSNDFLRMDILKLNLLMLLSSIHRVKDTNSDTQKIRHSGSMQFVIEINIETANILNP